MLTLRKVQSPGSVAAQRLLAQSTRSFSKSHLLNQEKQPIIAKEAPKKKSHGFRKFVLSSLLITSAVYGAGVWYSLKDDKFHDVFTEYVPFSDSVINALEEREFRSKFRDVDINKGTSAIAINTDSLLKRIPTTLNNLKVKIKPGSSAEPKDVAVDTAKDKDAGKSAVAVAISTPPPPPAPAPASSSKAVAPSTPLPLIHIKGDTNPLVNSSIETLNQFISSVNSATYGEDIVNKISKEISNLSQSINAIHTENREQLTKSLESQAARFASLGEARANEVKSALSSQEQAFKKEFHEEQSRILQLYNERLLTEVEATKNLVISHANNRLLAIHAEREKQFAKEIADRVEQEREGRLSKIHELTEKVEKLSQLTENSSSILDESEKITQYHIAVGKLTSILKSSPEPVALGPYIEEIKTAFPEDSLVQSILTNIPQDVYNEGVLTTAQLSARFRLLVPELRSASLLPPNAGVAGHVGSIVFSKLLAGKFGNPIGEDNESIFARAETALVEGRVIDAVSEINSLTGWPKKLAADWLSEGRKRSEVEFLAQALADEGKLWTLSNK